MEQRYAQYAVEKAVQLLAIDSPTGFTDKAAEWVLEAFASLGFDARKTTKGGILIDLGGEESAEGGLLLQAHTDTLGAMVAEITANGRLRVTSLGGMRAENGETENVRVYTRSGKVYEGTLQLCNASVHVNGEYAKTNRTFDTTEILLDENVSSAEETRALGIETGDIVCFDPRTHVTASGYIKSRFLDDKLSVGILLGFAKYLHDEKKTLPRRTYVHVTVYEEVGFGGSASVPEGVTESISVDMGCVGDGLACTERQVSICAKDSGGPYSYAVVGKLIDAAKAHPSFQQGSLAFSRHLTTLPNLEDLVTAFYRVQWWDKMGLARWPQLVANELFEQAVNLGRDGSGKLLQRVCNAMNYVRRNGKEQRLFDDLDEDGAVGPKTVKALALVLEYRAERDVVHALNAAQGKKYLDIAASSFSQRKFLAGWMTRAV